MSNPKESAPSAFGEDGPTHALTVLTRLASRDPEGELLLREVLREEFPALGWDAFAVAIETGDPMGRLLADCIQRQEDLPWIETLYDRWMEDPRAHSSITLLEANVALIERALALREACKTELDRDELNVRASLAGNLGHFLQRLGRPQEAILKTEQALRWYEELARDDSDFDELRAMAHANLGGIYLELNRLPEAREETEKSLAVRRRLWRQDPDRYRDDLIVTLDNLGALLDDLHLPNEAIEILEEAVALCRDRDPRDPETDRHLGTTLLHLASALAAVDREQDASHATRQSVESFRRLLSERDELAHPLALSLHNLSVRLAARDRIAEAIETLEEAIAIQEDLARVRPQGFQPWLARSLGTLRDHLSTAGRWDEARQAGERTIELWRDIAERDLESALPDSAKSQIELARILFDTGQPDAALAMIEDPLAQLRKWHGEGRDWLGPSLAIALIMSGSLLLRSGRADDGLDRLLDGLRLLEDFALRHPQGLLLRRASTTGEALGSLLRADVDAADRVARVWADQRGEAPDALLPGEVLSSFAGLLFSAGRVADAVILKRQALREHRRERDWLSWAGTALSYMEILLAWGEFDQALEMAREWEELGRSLPDEDLLRVGRVYRGVVAHHQGDRSRAASWFRELFEDEDAYFDTFWAYRYGDFLLDEPEVAARAISRASANEVRRLVSRIFALGEEREGHLDTALGNLLLGRLTLLAAHASGNKVRWSEAEAQIDAAIHGLRLLVYGDLPRALATRARLSRLQGNFPAAHEALDEAAAFAARGPLLPSQCDVALERSCLAWAEKDLPAAHEHLKLAHDASASIGYGRRQQEIEELESTLKQARRIDQDLPEG